MKFWKKLWNTQGFYHQIFHVLHGATQVRSVTATQAHVDSVVDRLSVGLGCCSGRAAHVVLELCIGYDSRVRHLNLGFEASQLMWSCA